MKSFGDKIKLRREELNMSQDTLAKMVGYKSRSSINKIELGLADITQSRIMDIASALGTTPAYLMGWEDSSADVSFKKKEFIKRVENMTDDELDRLEQILALVEGKE